MTVSFGITTAPQQVGYDDLLRVWLEADALPTISHAWVFDHLFPIAGDRSGPIFEGWTLLAALAAQTSRLRLGVLVTSNRIRPPALLARIAATVDVISAGRLDFGIGVGSRPDIAWARDEYDAHGLPYVPVSDAIEALDEACTVIRRLWTSSSPFDFSGRAVSLRGAWCNPKPVQPSVPFVIGGRSSRTLRIAARHADIWNVPGFDVDDAISRSRVLDRYCAEAGRDPASLIRSIHLGVSYSDPVAVRSSISQALDGGFRHITLGLPSPYPPSVASWVASEVVAPFAG